MTKKDFEMIARVFRDKGSGAPGYVSTALETRIVDAESMANALAQTNSRFDRVRFLKACEPKED